MVRPGTLVVLAFSAVLFFIVRQFLIKWGLVDKGRNAGDFGLGRLFAWAAYFVLWICPSWIMWAVVSIARDCGWLR